MFNEKQKIAICHKNGPLIVLAGPGSGKTLVITYRTKYLIEEERIHPSKILVITFTKSAAEEMKQRFLQIMGQDRTQVTFGTFHSIFFRMLRSIQPYKMNQIIDENKKYLIIKSIIKSIELDYDDENEWVNNFILEMSSIKNELIDLEYYHSTYFSDDVFRNVFKQYENIKKQHQWIDFDDMLVLCYKELAYNKQFLSYWQRKFCYILIDEFQDINCIQYECSKLLAKLNNNLFIVGDDDQAIYQFRGARPDFLLNFKKEYKDAQQIILNNNYRSTKNIVKSSLKVINNNKKRFKKIFITENKIGSAPIINEYKDTNEEVIAVTEQIQKLLHNNIPIYEIAIIFRTNIQARPFIQHFLDLNLPFNMRDSMPNIFEHWIAKDIVAYITLTVNIKDKEALTRIINKPKRYISKRAIAYASNKFNNIWEGLYDFYKNQQEYVKLRLDDLQYHITALKKMTPIDAIRYIRTTIDYDSYLVDYAKYRKINKEGLYEIANSICESCINYKTFDDWLDYIEHYKKQLKQNMFKKNKSSNETITLSTMHSVKGLEFRAVFLISTNEGIIPHDKSLIEIGIEEERRLFYVAMTRSKEYLYISYIKERFNQFIEASRFIKELRLSLSELKEGMDIYHKLFGSGKLLKFQNNNVKIYFYESKKIKNLSLQYCIDKQLLILQK